MYRVKDWDNLFENNKSRERDQCSYVCIPNKQHGMGLTRILGEADGAAIYGIWQLIIGACSRQRRPRQGYLTDDGRADGRAWSDEDIAFRYRRPVREVKRAVEVLCSQVVGWMEVVTDDGSILSKSARRVPVECPRREEKGIEGNGKEEECGEPAGAAPPPPPDDFLDDAYPWFPCVPGRKGKERSWKLDDAMLAEWVSAFPGVDVAAECRRAHAWIRSNPARKKTAGGMSAFLFRWFQREQNSPRASGGKPRPRATPRGAFSGNGNRYCPG